jgi:hypothetical protein
LQAFAPFRQRALAALGQAESRPWLRFSETAIVASLRLVLTTAALWQRTIRKGTGGGTDARNWPIGKSGASGKRFTIFDSQDFRPSPDFSDYRELKLSPFCFTANLGKASLRQRAGEDEKWGILKVVFWLSTTMH